MSDYWKEKIAQEKATFDEWEAKLKESLESTGQRDIEYRVNGEPADYLVGPNPMDFVRAGQRRIENNSNYYELAREFRWWLREQPDVDHDQCRIWDLHAEGKSIMSVVKALGLKRHLVSKTITALKKDMLRRVRQAEAPFTIGQL